MSTPMDIVWGGRNVRLKVELEFRYNAGFSDL